MGLFGNKVDINDKEISEEYHDTIYGEKHEWRDYELTSAGFDKMSLRQVLLLPGLSDIRFISQKWPLTWTPRHLAYRLARLL